MLPVANMQSATSNSQSGFDTKDHKSSIPNLMGACLSLPPTF